MKKGIYKLAIILAASSIISSCEKSTIKLDIEGLCSESIILNERYIENTEGQTVLGDVINIPYSIENLLTAYNNLPGKTKSQIDVEDIKPTHYYVRFYPKSIEDLDILRNIKPYVFLSEIPLDRKIVVGGSSYHDPAIPDYLPTYQYTVIPVERWDSLKENVPVEMEVLIKAFIPDYDEEYSTKSASAYGIPTNAYEELLMEAYRITGTKYDKITRTKVSWTPSGRIRAYDDYYGTMLAVPGVRVRATHLLKVKETLTDEYGYFTLPSFSNPVNMRIIWESDDWDIRNGAVGQATFDGPELYTSSWQCNLGSEHEKNIRFAANHRAAYRIFYGDADGLYPPVLTNKLKICQHDSYNSHSGSYENNSQNISVYVKESTGTYKSTNTVYYVVSQELGHACHHSWVGSAYNNFTTSIKESWSVFFGEIMYEKEYYTFLIHYQFWPLEQPEHSFDIHYTPIFIDMYDNVNQRNAYSSCPNDNVTGYTPETLNYLMLSSTNLASLKTNAKVYKPSGVTNSMIDTLFSVYEENWVD